MRIRKTTALTALLTFALTAMILVGTTLAYLTDTDTTTNVTYAFNANDVEIELTEPIWDAQKSGDGFSGDAVLMSPGRKIIKDPQVTVLEGSAECYVRLRVEVNAELKEIIDFPIAPGNGWTFVNAGLRNDKETAYYLLYYYYPTKLGERATTTRAFEHIRVKTEDELDGLALGILEQLTKDQEMKITVSAEVIQAFGFTSYNQAMEALEAAAGNWNGENIPDQPGEVDEDESEADEDGEETP